MCGKLLLSCFSFLRSDGLLPCLPLLPPQPPRTGLRCEQAPPASGAAASCSIQLRQVVSWGSPFLGEPSPQGCFLVLEEVLPWEVGTRLSSEELVRCQDGAARPAPGGCLFARV